MKTIQLDAMRRSTRSVVDRHQALRAEREARVGRFLDGSRPYLIFQSPPGEVWGDVRTREACFRKNLDRVAASLDVPSDHLPVMEPWFGTGVYANMYGCPYVWRDGEAPAVRYKYAVLDEVCGLPKPRWEDGEIARLVLDAIRYFKSRTGDALPIVWTDTQSASDTATLVLDACEVMAGCLTAPDAVMAFMCGINAVIVEFSHVQAEEIGDALLKPGHIMLCGAGLGGMSISDDNLAVCSPAVSERINLPLNEEIGRAMGGVAIHSCGNWERTMPLIAGKVPSCVAADCALEGEGDPNPNRPEAVRDAFAGTGIHVHARVSGETEQMRGVVERLLHPGLKLIAHPGYVDLPTAERNYDVLERMLGDFFAAGHTR